MKVVERAAFKRIISFGLTAVLLIPFLGQAVSAEADQDADALLRRFLEVNRIWLDPSPGHLSYELLSIRSKGEEVERKIHRVWLEGRNKARWETEGGPVNHERYGKGASSHIAVFSPDRECHIFNWGEKRYERIIPRVDCRYLCQGVTWETGIHALADEPAAFDLSIVERNKSEEGETAVLEAVLEDRVPPRVQVLLDLQNLWMSPAIYYPIQKIRVGIRMPDLAPLFEEGLGEDDVCFYKVEYGPGFLASDDQRAPEFMRFRPFVSIERQRKEIIEARFQIMDGNWLLKEGTLQRKGVKVQRLYLKEVSTRAADPELFDIRKVLPDDYEPPARLSSLQAGDSAHFEVTSHGCWHHIKYEFEFKGGAPFTVEVFHWKKGERQSLGVLELTSEDQVKLDKALDFYRNPYPGMSSTSVLIFEIDWRGNGESVRTEKFHNPNLDSVWSDITCMTIHTILDRLSE